MPVILPNRQYNVPLLLENLYVANVQVSFGFVSTCLPVYYEMVQMYFQQWPAAVDTVTSYFVFVFVVYYAFAVQ